MDLFASITAFVQAAQSGSFVEAGRALGLSPSAISKSVARLEAEYATSLFHRSTRSLSLTEDGRSLLRRARLILDEMAAAREELAQGAAEPRGVLRLGLPNVASLVVPLLDRFLEQHPAIDLDIDLSDRIVDVIDDGFDAVIRTGTLADSRLKTRLLGRYRMRMVASVGYIARAGHPLTPEDLRDHDNLQYRFHATGKVERWPFSKSYFGEGEPPARATMNSTELRLALVRAGRGFALLPDFLVDDDIRTGALVTFFNDLLEFEGSFHILWPAGKRPSAKVSAFIDFTTRHFREGLIANGTR